MKKFLDFKEKYEAIKKYYEENVDPKNEDFDFEYIQRQMKLQYQEQWSIGNIKRRVSQADPDRDLTTNPEKVCIFFLAFCELFCHPKKVWLAADGHQHSIFCKKVTRSSENKEN